MVNSHATEPTSETTPANRGNGPVALPLTGPAPTAAALGAAFAATEVPYAVLRTQPSGIRVVWVNDALARAVGYAADTIVGLDVLADPRVRPTDPEAVREYRRGPSTHPVVLRRADGVHVRCVAHVSAVPAGADVPPGTLVAGVQDLTAELSASAEQAALVAEERRERRSLSLIARVSDLLMDVDEPHGLREIAALLESEVVERADFFLFDNGLWAADGLEPVRAGVARHHGPSGRMLSRCRQDPVGRLLAGTDGDVLELDLAAEHPEGTYAQWLSARLASDDADGDQRVVVQVVPGRRRPVGMLVVRPRGGGGTAALDASERTVVELVARRVGLSIDNVRLYDREHRLAETLQRAMLPEQAEVDGLDVWTYYSPNSDDVQVGGDWYDVLQIDPQTVGVVIGDVVGHDVEAAATMGQLRSVVRSYAFDITTPGPVLDRVDQLFGGMRIPRAASLVYSALVRGEGGCWTLRYSRAGHLPLLHVRDGRTRLLRGTGGRLVGFGEGGRATDEVELAPGDVVVYYTDGLVERRDRSLRAGLEELETVAAAVTARDAAGIGEDLLSRLADHPEDDVAVVVLRVPGTDDHLAGAVSPRRRRWALPSEPASIGRARHAVVRTCQAWEIPDAANAELVVSELVANAVLHGWGHVALQLYDTGDGLRIEVEDANPTPPVTTDGHPGRVGGFGMQIVERLADWGWRQSRGGKVVWAKVRPGSLPASARHA
ncbi:SpoIIE family protein phosphatase [Cellulomonas sp. zg-ZUI199]|uniref:SpoIIE family protein phosphatase n=1 Tax=Cellulomonas wangleii TaxID=2816956 RepID=A0ABX8DA30_9CELL|nr:SpoIIE family protein phosphatase [Cellulomonas wangleii]QVI64333.1 SpoIIE family protein phosphatase [Cellulomonas wangleii]